MKWKYKLEWNDISHNNNSNSNEYPVYVEFGVRARGPGLNESEGSKQATHQAHIYIVRVNCLLAYLNQSAF